MGGTLAMTTDKPQTINASTAETCMSHQLPPGIGANPALTTQKAATCENEGMGWCDTRILESTRPSAVCCHENHWPVPGKDSSDANDTQWQFWYMQVCGNASWNGCHATLKKVWHW